VGLCDLQFSLRHSEPAHAKPDPEVVNQLTWEKPWEVLSGKIKGWKDPRVLSVGLMTMFVLLYTLFR